jgi:hypothetical protein
MMSNRAVDLKILKIRSTFNFRPNETNYNGAGQRAFLSYIISHSFPCIILTDVFKTIHWCVENSSAGAEQWKWR